MTIRLDLSTLPPPDIIETLDYEKILTACKQCLQDICDRDADLKLEVDTLPESEPIIKILEVLAYRELYCRQCINEATQQCMIASASGGYLDQLAALLSLERADGESDDDLRSRMQSIFAHTSTAGPRSAYEFYAKAVSIVDEQGIREGVKEVAIESAKSFNRGEVIAIILSDKNDGIASDELVAAVTTELNKKQLHPITDRVTVQKAANKEYTIEVDITMDTALLAPEVEQTIKKRMEKVAAEHHRIGVDLTLSTLRAALIQQETEQISSDAETGVYLQEIPSIQKVVFNQPIGDIKVNYNEAPYLTNITITPIVTT